LLLYLLIRCSVRPAVNENESQLSRNNSREETKLSLFDVIQAASRRQRKTILHIVPYELLYYSIIEFRPDVHHLALYLTKDMRKSMSVSGLLLLVFTFLSIGNLFSTSCSTSWEFIPNGQTIIVLPQ